MLQKVLKEIISITKQEIILIHHSILPIIFKKI